MTDLTHLSVLALGREPHPTPERELELVRQAQAGDVEARNRLIMANGRLVIKIAMKHQSALSLADRCQEGVLGLVRAIEKFDPERGFKLSTYATWWIRQAISRANLTQAGSVRIPVHTGELIKKINRLEPRQNGSDPAALATELGVSESSVKQALSHRRPVLSLDAPLEKGEPAFNLLAVFPGRSDLESKIEARQAAEQVEQLLTKLPARSARVLCLRFGLGDQRPLKLREIAEKYGLTRERIRQIEKEALIQLKEMTGGQKEANGRGNVDDF